MCFCVPSSVPCPPLFLALLLQVREQAVVLMGRLTAHNPAYVLPSLRRHLVQLLLDIEHTHESKQREEAARILTCLVRACTLLVTPYLSCILKVLVEKLKESSSVHAASAAVVGGAGASGVVTSMLITVGELSRLGGAPIRPYLGISCH